MENEKFTGLNVQSEQFTLRKVNVSRTTKLGTIEAELDLSKTNENKTYKVKIEPSYQVNESFEKALAQFKPWLMDVCNIQKDHEKDVIVTGVILAGNGEKSTWKMVGVLRTATDQYTKIESAKTHHNSGHYMWDSDIITAINDLEEEAFEYAFNEAKAQLTIFDEEKEKIEDAKEVPEEQE